MALAEWSKDFWLCLHLLLARLLHLGLKLSLLLIGIVAILALGLEIESASPMVVGCVRRLGKQVARCLKRRIIHRPRGERLLQSFLDILIDIRFCFAQNRGNLEVLPFLFLDGFQHFALEFNGLSKVAIIPYVIARQLLELRPDTRIARHGFPGLPSRRGRVGIIDATILPQHRRVQLLHTPIDLISSLMRLDRPLARGEIRGSPCKNRGSLRRVIVRSQLLLRKRTHLLAFEEVVDLYVLWLVNLRNATVILLLCLAVVPSLLAARILPHLREIVEFQASLYWDHRLLGWLESAKVEDVVEVEDGVGLRQ